MADNLALKLLVAGIIGAVLGAAAAERYHFPTGLVYGGLNSRTRPPIDPMIGSGRAPIDDRPRLVLREPPDYWPDWPPRRYRAPPRSAPRTAMCWREFEDWNFGTTGHYVPCRRSQRPRDDG